jgi:hypothetical protein
MKGINPWSVLKSTASGLLCYLYDEAFQILEVAEEITCLSLGELACMSLKN